MVLFRYDIAPWQGRIAHAFTHNKKTNDYKISRA